MIGNTKGIQYNSFYQLKQFDLITHYSYTTAHPYYDHKSNYTLLSSGYG